ncbi:putative acetyltransferase [Bradyrhizobium sp. STM 3843]|uniref:GNAT family N-acetyltransferase n=1 Tax=Bradyrhizobium sp. STM 3843 TaxID=551947 RepID=UPI000240A42D|nr:GNAT family N-acetyltransferase [Bradyrhizobium sp. STM 3843]CCE04378.1 putative acetyltransferase [Bradyrhizobium sp. STM 3843]
MTAKAIELVAFGPEHLKGALALSQQAGWPHRIEDWQTALALSTGFAAVSRPGNDVIGTVLLTSYRDDAASISMVLVAKAMRGRGLGRKLMEAALALAGNRPLRLVATDDGLPLYQKLNFERTGVIAQHQGIARSSPLPAAIRPIMPAEIPTAIELDRVAFGADRADLISHLAKIGSFAVLDRAGAPAGFAVLRPFGRGEVIGPVVTKDVGDAKALIAHVLASCAGRFVRIDTDITTGLGPWLIDQGLDHVGGGVAMRRPVVARSAAPFTTFALANQALG